MKRKYMETHNFIDFNIDFSSTSFELWLLLGAAESKCKHLAGIPLRPEKQQELNQISLKKGIMATTAIEGNTLSEEDVEKIYKGKENEIPLSRQYQAQEIKNVLQVYNEIASDIDNGQISEISVDTLKTDNLKVLGDIELEDGIIPGEIRTYPVVVGNSYKGAPAEDCEFLLNELFNWLGQDWGLNKRYPIVEGILKAITAHLYLTWIHPFGDGNGRCARILEFRLLMNIGVPLTAAHLLTSYYNDTKDRYYEILKISSRKKNGVLLFIQYAVQGFIDALDGQIKSILDEQLNITWENYVHEVCFSGKLTTALRRRRDLLLEISSFEKAIPLKELRYRLSDEILRQYQEKASSLSRDLSYLEKRRLIRMIPNEGYIAEKEKMKAFLPISLT